MDKFRDLALGAILMGIPEVQKTEHHLILRSKNEDCKIEHRNGVYIVFTNDGPKRYETVDQIGEYLNITLDSIMQKVADDPALSRHLIAGIATEAGTNEANTTDNATTEAGTNEANTTNTATTEKPQTTRKRNGKKSE